MGYYSKYTDRMDIHIEESRGTILIKQKWRYFWLNSMNTSRWTYSEKQKFHKEVDNLIWNSWGEHFFLKVKGTSDFAIRNIKKRWDVNFDIEWVQYGEHWKVNVKKNPSKTFMKSNVKWYSKEMNLDTLDTSKQKRIVQGKNYFQYPVVHEFGHSAGNSIAVGNGDEYNSSSYSMDKNSLMNVGDELRDRHLDFIISELNTMITRSTFSKY
ncbi:hypothetical protein [Tenacibaculum maritimum]|uniref:hypothetical protein n=4 Tax=Tenacibaculum maritimum TaxID=107401 RepID=UPI0012E596D9|nr:conserved hypothetical protein [Tenacibaculum maritimum]